MGHTQTWQKMPGTGSIHWATGLPRVSWNDTARKCEANTAQVDLRWLCGCFSFNQFWTSSTDTVLWLPKWPIVKHIVKRQGDWISLPPWSAATRHWSALPTPYSTRPQHGFHRAGSHIDLHVNTLTLFIKPSMPSFFLGLAVYLVFHFWLMKSHSCVSMMLTCCIMPVATFQQCPELSRFLLSTVFIEIEMVWLKIGYRQNSIADAELQSKAMVLLVLLSGWTMWHPPKFRGRRMVHEDDQMAGKWAITIKWIPAPHKAVGEILKKIKKRNL